MATIVFIHQNGLGQFIKIATDLLKAGHRVVNISRFKRILPNGIIHVQYTPAGIDAIPPIMCAAFEESCLHGRAVARALATLKDHSVTPDVIVGHTGWGELLFAREVFPFTKIIGYFEYYFRESGQDVGFDPEYPPDSNVSRKLIIRNAVSLLTAESVDILVAPTEWQKTRFPEHIQSKMIVCHEGIDTDLCRPREGVTLRLPTGKTLSSQDFVVTYVARNLEPYRGFHIFMRAAKLIYSRMPSINLVVVGGDDVSYGYKHPSGRTYREFYIDDLDINLSKVHFLGAVDYATYRGVLAISSAHVYLTYPFVLSWSLLEAMATGVALTASRTAPVLEVVQHEKEGLLVDFFNSEAIADNVIKLVSAPEDYCAMKHAARDRIVTLYDLESVCLPRWRELIFAH